MDVLVAAIGFRPPPSHIAPTREFALVAALGLHGGGLVLGLIGLKDAGEGRWIAVTGLILNASMPACCCGSCLLSAVAG
jgi:hypothetical protein